MNADTKSIDQSNHSLLDEAEKLIWALLDERIEESEITRLETLLKDHTELRSRYLQISQIHSNLYEHYDRPQNSLESPILSMVADLEGEMLAFAN